MRWHLPGVKYPEPTAPEAAKSEREEYLATRHHEYIKLRNRRLAAGLTAKGKPRKQHYPLTYQ